VTSKSDLKRYDQLLRIGCSCCNMIGLYRPGDIHHIVSKGYRRLSGGNKSTIMLCEWHHRAVGPKGSRDVLGPSLADGSKPFVAFWGTERSLLKKVNSMIGVK
jgi:hypothetical protein